MSEIPGNIPTNPWGKCPSCDLTPAECWCDWTGYCVEHQRPYKTCHAVNFPCRPPKKQVTIAQPAETATTASALPQPEATAPSAPAPKQDEPIFNVPPKQDELLFKILGKQLTLNQIQEQHEKHLFALKRANAKERADLLPQAGRFAFAAFRAGALESGARFKLSLAIGHNSKVLPLLDESWPENGNAVIEHTPQASEPAPQGFFTANGKQYPRTANDSHEAVKEHLANTARLIEEARQHPERGLTAEEQSSFNKRFGTIEQRLAIGQLLPNASTLAYSLANLFRGNPAGFYQRDDQGKYNAVKREATVLDFLAHIKGSPDRSLLSVPVLASGMCHWGAIDVDCKGETEEPIDWPALAKRVTELGLHLVVCRSKGGKGAWLFLFFRDEEGVSAHNAEKLLKHYAQRLDLRALVIRDENLEIFPKQKDLNTNKGIGSGINIPYRLNSETLTSQAIAFGKQGEELSLQGFIELAHERTIYGGLEATRLTTAEASTRNLEEPNETTIEEAITYLDTVCTKFEGMIDGRQEEATRRCFYLGRVIGGKPQDPRLEFETVKQRITEAIKNSKGPKWPPERYEVINRQLREGMQKPIKIVAEEEIEIRDWPELPGEEAFAGLVGDFTRVWEQHTEASPTALVAQFLTFFGHAVGRSPYFAVGGDDHHTNLEIALVGPTSFARKGQSYGCVKHTFEKIVLQDLGAKVINETQGLSTGEGLIATVRDPRWEPNKKGQTIMVDEGVLDKRVLVFESEFASVLRRMVREGSTLSEVMRQLWDSGNLGTMTRNAPLKATNAHISLITHVTRSDLQLYLNDVSTMNGFANRFIFLATRRVRSLPDPGRPSEGALREIATRLAKAIEFGQGVKQMLRSPEATAAWAPLYNRLTAPRTGRQHNAVVARAAAHVLRLSMIYALLDGSAIIEARHQDSAVALWDYAERTSSFVFGNSLGDKVAEKILELLRTAPQGLTTREITAKTYNKKHVAEALGLLYENGQIRRDKIHNTGKGGGGYRWVVV